MSDTPTKQSPNGNQTERPAQPPDRGMDSEVIGTFPASDPIASTATQGARAVSPADLLRPSDDEAQPADAVRFALRFPSHEAAKLAVETAVREAPLDRRCASIRGKSVEVAAPRADVERVREILRRHGGEE